MNKPRSELSFILLTMSLWLTGCPTPKQYGGPIPVDQEGLTTRLGVLCELGLSSRAAAGLCPTAHAAPSPHVNLAPERTRWLDPPAKPQPTSTSESSEAQYFADGEAPSGDRGRSPFCADAPGLACEPAKPPRQSALPDPVDMPLSPAMAAGRRERGSP